MDSAQKSMSMKYDDFLLDNRIVVNKYLNKDKPDASLSGLEKVADEDMYIEKAKFYKERGIERRR